MRRKTMAKGMNCPLSIYSSLFTGKCVYFFNRLLRQMQNKVILTILNADEDFGIKTGHKIPAPAGDVTGSPPGSSYLLGTRAPYVMST